MHKWVILAIFEFLNSQLSTLKSWKRAETTSHTGECQLDHIWAVKVNHLQKINILGANKSKFEIRISNFDFFQNILKSGVF